MQSYFKSTFLCFVFLLIALPGISQGLPKPFLEITDSLLEAEPKSFENLDTSLGPYVKDTLLMKHFVIQSAEKNYLHGMAYGYNQLGIWFRDISNFPRAIHYHTKALEAARTAQNTELHILSLNMLGIAYLRNDAIKMALDFNQEALDLARSVINPSPVIKKSMNASMNGIGNIYRMLEQYDLAIELFKESLELEEELGNTLGMAINYSNIGECLEAEGKLNESLENYQRALAMNELVNSDRLRIISNFGIAHVYVHQEKLDEALTIFKTILPISESLGDKELISSILINIGWTMIHLNRPEEAMAYLKEGLDMSERYQLISNIYTANTFIHDLYESQGDYQKALEYHKKAQEVKSQISNDRNRQYVYDVISRSEAEKRSSQIEVLARENEIVKLRLRRNQNTLLISALMLALFSLILYILYRQYQLKSDQKLLTLEQSMLRSQMNPHFLFNSLNSIKLYIINNEKRNAVHYLNKFSKLVRKILEASSVKEISLADELETVELYMNIENIRFNNEIQFEIVIDDDIDPHLVKIPSLILQPFLENALWHGLSSKSGEKKIQVSVSRENKNFIQISITDNGVGREEAEKLKQSKVLKRKSVGIEITRERLANFSKDYQNSFRVEIIDLKDKNQKAAGTQIVLHIPTI